MMCLACVSCSSPSSSGSSVAEAKAIGVEKFGHDQFAVGIIPASKGPVTEAGITGLSVAFGPSNLVRDTISRLKQAQARQLDVLFCGSTPAKTERIVVESLAILPAGSLPGMRIHVVGVDPSKLEDAVHRVGAKLVK